MPLVARLSWVRPLQGLRYNSINRIYILRSPAFLKLLHHSQYSVKAFHQSQSSPSLLWIKHWQEDLEKQDCPSVAEHLHTIADHVRGTTADSEGPLHHVVELNGCKRVVSSGLLRSVE